MRTSKVVTISSPTRSWRLTYTPRRSVRWLTVKEGIFFMLWLFQKVAGMRERKVRVIPNERSAIVPQKS